MEVNRDGDDLEQIFYDTVREYVVSVKLSVFFSFLLLKFCRQTTVQRNFDQRI